MLGKILKFGPHDKLHNQEIIKVYERGKVLVDMFPHFGYSHKGNLWTSHEFKPVWVCICVCMWFVIVSTVCVHALRSLIKILQLVCDLSSTSNRAQYIEFTVLYQTVPAHYWDYRVKYVEIPKWQDLWSTVTPWGLFNTELAWNCFFNGQFANLCQLGVGIDLMHIYDQSF